MHLNDLENESSKTDETGQTGAREGGDLTSTGSGDGGTGRGNTRSSVRNSVRNTAASVDGATTDGGGGGNIVAGGGGRNDSGEGDARDRGDTTGVASNHGGSDHRASDGARAVSDGEGGGLGDGVGLAAVSDLGRPRAVGGVNVNDLGGDGDVGTPGSSASSGSENSGDGELHFVDWSGWFLKKLKKASWSIRYLV